MRTITLVVMSLAIAFCACGQKVKETEVPPAVLDKFKAEYPSKTDVKWEKKGSNFEAKYKDKNEYLAVQYDKDGNVVQLEHEIALSLLPAEVKTYTEKNAPGKNITEAYMVTDKNGDKVYECVIEQTTYVFDSNGNYKDKKAKKIRK
jgi:hypothetical protein